MVTDASNSQASLRILLVADEQFQGSAFLDEVKSHIDGRSAEVEVFVIAPALAGSGLVHEMASSDVPAERAEKRLESILTELRKVGIEAIGEIGDEDPVVAIGDGLAEFPADEIVLVSHAKSDEAYGEKNLWERIHNEYHQPIVDLVVGHEDGDGNAPAVESIQREPAHVQTSKEEIDATRNFPPLRTRDITGIIVGLLGTIAMGLIAVGAGNAESGGISGAAAAVVLLAIGAFLLNAAHTVGLLFFQSVRYEGIWEKFMARLAIVYTGAALVASLILWSTI